MNIPNKNKWLSYNNNSPLISFFNHIYPISARAEAELNKFSYPISLKSGKFLISPLKTDENLYLIIKGVIRGFVKEENKEITTWIHIENEIVSSIRNHGLKSETEEYLQALEDCILIVLPRTFINRMYIDYPEMNIIARILLEEKYRSSEERAYISRIPSATKRYLRFAKMNANLLKRIPLKYIASYLGITFETLSRIRTKLSKKKT